MLTEREGFHYNLFKMNLQHFRFVQMVPDFVHSRKFDLFLLMKK